MLVKFYVKVGIECMKGGYTLINCTGIDLLEENEQTINGIYNKVKNAVNTGKMMIAENLVWGDQGKITPVPVFVVDWGTFYVVTSSTLQVWVTNADKVTVHNMAPANNT